MGAAPQPGMQPYGAAPNPYAAPPVAAPAAKKGKGLVLAGIGLAVVGLGTGVALIAMSGSAREETVKKFARASRLHHHAAVRQARHLHAVPRDQGFGRRRGR